MRFQEKEIVQAYIEMYGAMKDEGVNCPSETIAILTVARVLARVMEKCTFEICGSIDQIPE